MKIEFVDLNMKNVNLTEIEWSHFSTTCAAISEHHNLHIFKSNGNELKYSIPNQGKNTSISWSYRSDLLAIGSSNSTLTLFSNKTKQTKLIQLNTLIKQTFRITKIFWNFYNEEICLISDDNRILSLNITEKYDTRVIFCFNLNFSIENAIYINKSKIILNNKEGEIYLITKDSPKYLTTILIPVHFLFCPKTSQNQLFSLSSDNILTIFFLNEKNELKKLDQRKLNDGHFTHIEEIGNDRLAYSIDDKIYIEKNGENSIELFIQKSDKITDFHFYEYSDSLVAVSEKGTAFVWSINGEIQLIHKFEKKFQNTKTFMSTFSEAFCSINENEKSFSIDKMPKIRFLNSGYSELMQISANTLISNSMNRIQKVEFSIEKVRQTKNHFLIVSNSKCKIFNFNLECINEFEIQSNLIEISGSRILTFNGQKIDIKNIVDNSVLNSIQIESNGSIIKTTLNGTFLAVLTTSNEIFIFDIAKFSINQKAKLNASQLIELNSVTSLGISIGGFCVSINCRTSTSRSKSILMSTTSNNIEKNSFTIECIQLKWDTESPNLFCARTYENSIATYLIDDDLKAVQLKTLSFPSNHSLLKISVPRFYHSPLNSPFFSATSKFLPSFTSLDEAPNHLKRNIVQLMLYAKSGNYDSAQKLIEKIDDKRALNQFLSDNEYIEFFSKLISESEIGDDDSFPELMHRSLKTGNLSLLMPQNDENYDAKNWFARFSEFKGDTKTALPIYEECENEIDQVRVLCMMNRFADAKKIVDNTSDKSVICYFARMLIKLKSNLESSINENKTDNEEQIKTETDNNNEHKIQINENETSNKCKIENNENDNKEKFKNDDFCSQIQSKDDADLFTNSEKVGHLIVDLFCRSSCYGAAFEFAAQSKFYDDLANLSILAPTNLVYKVAKSIESQHTNSVLPIQLYFTSGHLSEAVNYAVKTMHIEYLPLFEDKIQGMDDTHQLFECAEYFEKVGNYEEAVNFYAYSNCIEKVEELCETKKLKISENLIDFLSSVQSEQAARLLNEQGQFLKAAQIYSNLKQNKEALNSLIKLNDIEKVCDFVEAIKSPSCYEIAADYIAGTFDPKRNSPLFQRVIEFYRKSENFEKIAKFLESRAKMEIDLSQNYEKALDLLKQSQHYIAMTDSQENVEWADNILNKIRWIEMYIEAASTNSPEVMETVCNALINTKNAFDIVRYEDVVFLQIQNFLKNENFVDAQKLIDTLSEKGVDIEKFIESDSIKRIYRAASCNDPFDLSDEMPDDDSFIIEHFSDS